MLSFAIIAAVVYFLVVQPAQRLMDRFRPDPEPERPVKECPECLSKIPEGAMVEMDCHVIKGDPPYNPDVKHSSLEASWIDEVD